MGVTFFMLKKTKTDEPGNFTRGFFGVDGGVGYGVGWGQTNNYFGTSGTLTGNVWSTNAGGPYTSVFNATGGGIANFQNTGSMNGGSITVAGISATASVVLSSPSGTISNLSNGIITIDVGSGATLDFSGQSFTSSATAGYIKNGSGVLAMGGNTYGGGFTLNAGTMIVRGVNAMGGTASNTLTINGGTLAANGSRDLTGKYGGGITIGGDFTIGATTVLAAPSSANLTFSNNVSLGTGASRTITIGGTGLYTFSGIISGSGSNLTVDNTAGGIIVLTGANTYSGLTTISGGTLQLVRTGGTTIPATNNVVVNSGTLLISSNQALNDLTIASGASVSVVGATLTINGTLNCGPTAIISGTGTFTLASGATLQTANTAGITASGATGSIQTSTRNFSTGANYVYNGTAAQNTGNGLPATVSNLTFANTGGAVTFNAAKAIANDFVITTGSVANPNGFMHTANTLTLGGAGQSGGTWGATGSGATNINNTFFSGTGLVTVSTSLPIELLYFDAKVDNGNTHLTWSTATELNNDYFQIERSTEGRSFEATGRVDGAGTSYEVLAYAFTDDKPLPGWNYYRLKQVDFDGQYAYSPVRAVLMGQTNAVSDRLAFFPNPAGHEIFVQSPTNPSPGDQLEIFDQFGRLVLQLQATEALETPLDLSALPAGLYVARLQSATGFSTGTFLVKR